MTNAKWFRLCALIIAITVFATYTPSVAFTDNEMPVSSLSDKTESGNSEGPVKTRGVGEALWYFFDEFMNYIYDEPGEHRETYYYYYGHSPSTKFNQGQEQVRYAEDVVYGWGDKLMEYHGHLANFLDFWTEITLHIHYAWQGQSYTLALAHLPSNVYLYVYAPVPGKWQYTYTGSTTEQKTWTLHYWNHKATGGPPVGCPRVAGWNGEYYEAESIIMPQSEQIGNNSTVTDYYNFENDPVSRDGDYSIWISENTNNTTSQFNRVRIATIDHYSTYDVLMSGDGNVFTMGSVSSPTASSGSGGGDPTAKITNKDGDLGDEGTYYRGEADTSLDIYFGNVPDPSSSNLEITTLIWPPWKKMSVGVEVLTDGPDWVLAGSFYPRDGWSSSVIDISQIEDTYTANLTVRLNFQVATAVDYVALDTGANQYTAVSYPPLKSAYKAYEGNVTGNLTSSDLSFTILRPGEYIELLFYVPPIPVGLVRDIVFVAEGYYVDE